jgi:chloramphenicol-sensitive protein RarD
VWYALAAYIAWGLLPIYWKLLHNVPAVELIGHRIAWSFAVLAVWITVQRGWRAMRVTLNRRIVLLYAAAAVLIGVNWLMYVWAVNAGYIIETSLGYFINPLLSVLLGVFVLGERLRPLQWAPLALAGAGVIYLAVLYGSPPWIALLLALTFALYGLVKKKAPLSALHGLTLETGLLFVPALGVIFGAGVIGQSSFVLDWPTRAALLIGTGLITTVPLLLFASAARRIPLTLVGILQYIAPTMQFLIGVFVYHEPFNGEQLIGFGMVWASLILFSIEGAWVARDTRRAKREEREARGA